MDHDGLAFHNVAELRADDDDSGLALQRVPESLRRELNEGARHRMTVPSGAEIRFVPDGEPVSVTLSCPAGEATAVPFWGPYQGIEPVTVGPDPEPVELTVPERVETLGHDSLGRLPFSPTVCRLRFGYDAPGPVRYHGVEGPHRPPTAAELPETRYLAYGTSITDGAAASRDHLTYPARAARHLGADLVNLGSGGSAFCEAELADYVAAEPWDVATLAISVNMLGAGFSVAEFRERATYMLDVVAGENPNSPVVAVTPFPTFADVDPATLPSEWATSPEEYRETLREVVRAVDRENLHLLEGPALLTDETGYGADLLHPGDDGMIQAGRALGEALAARC